MPKFTTSDGLSLHYEDTGTGMPVLALAGLTRDTRDFDYVAPHLADLRLIRMDYRGRGQSDWGDPATYHIPVEGRDAVELLDHLGIDKAAILGTSRGGIITMVLAATVRDRLLGVALNDIGPAIAEAGLDVIRAYIGRNPGWATHAEAAEKRAAAMTAFEGVPPERWLDEARKLYRETPEGLVIPYDPKLRDAVLAASENLAPDLWPLFDAMAGLPLAAIRGANSDLLTHDTFAEMQRRRPDMIAAEVPGRGHIPFLDEPEAVAALRAWVEKMQ